MSNYGLRSKSKPTGVQDFRKFHSSVCNFDIALENTVGNEVGGMTVWKLENTTGDNTGMETGGNIMEHEENSGNLDDFAEELRSPVRNFNIALEDSAENILEEIQLGTQRVQLEVILT